MEGELRKVMVRETERQRAARVLTNIIKKKKKMLKKYFTPGYSVRSASQTF